MRHVRARRWLGIGLGLTAFVACGESLIRDPSFDLWCKDTLCAPWEVSGHVRRVPTWHRSDYGVSLDDDALISQLSTHDPTACIAFTLIADVEASAQVWLEMDFNDDGSSEFKEVIPESHWAKQRFNAQTPRSYKNVRFILRKLGHGRAVLAQITAETNGDCGEKRALPATHRENSSECSSAGQCDGGACVARPPLVGTNARLACGECESDEQCPDEMFCGSLRGEMGYYAACVPRVQDNGAACELDAQCASGPCVQSLSFAVPTCGECASDDACAQGEVCGVRVSELGPFRGCRPAGGAPLAALCAGDAECASGVCDSGICSECNSAHPCAAGQCQRDTIPGAIFALAPGLCMDRDGMRASGEACARDENCASGACDGSDAVCYLCDAQGASCPELAAPECGIWRRSAGTCR
jgi:hypothetical protein